MTELVRRLLHTSMLIALTTVLVIGCSDDDGGTDPGDPPPPPSGDVDEKIRPILFVHDMYQAADVWNVQAQLFMQNSYEIGLMNAIDFERYLDAGTLDVSKMANQVKAQVDAIVAETGEGRVDIVAHGYGVQAVQFYLTRLSGTDRAAHIVFIAGEIDGSLTVGGTPTPEPCEYMTIVSDGTDGTQGGNASHGTMAGVTNHTIAGADHMQLVSSAETFEHMYKYFTGNDPGKTDIPRPQIAYPVEVTCRVLSYIDNEPIPNAQILMYNLKFDEQFGLGSFGPETPPLVNTTTDENGVFTATVYSTPGKYYDIEVRHPDWNYSRTYRISYRRAPYPFERVFVLPNTTAKGSSFLHDNLINKIDKQNDFSLCILHNPTRTFRAGRDEVTALFDVVSREPADSIEVGLNAIMPSDGSEGAVVSPNVVFLFDRGNDQQNSLAAINDGMLAARGHSSADLYFDATRATLSHGISLNNSPLYFQALRYYSNPFNANFKGPVWIKYELQ